ncbi:MAG: hypothetical protein V1737_02575 [Chloroflexota bacterium]
MYEVVWPRGRRVVEAGHFAKRLDSLEGKTVCALWDYLFRGNDMFPALGKELTKRYPSLKWVSYEKFGSTHGGDEHKTLADLPGKLRESGCDAVVSAMGC